MPTKVSEKDKFDKGKPKSNGSGKDEDNYLQLNRYYLTKIIVYRSEQRWAEADGSKVWRNPDGRWCPVSTGWERSGHMSLSILSRAIPRKGQEINGVSGCRE